MKIVQITDIHFWQVYLNPFKLLGKRALGNVNVWLRRRHEFVKERAEGFSDYVASLNPDRVLITGDFTSTATREEYLQARTWVDGLIQRGLELRAIPGNHDVYTFTSVRVNAFRKYFEDISAKDPLPCVETWGDGLKVLLVPTVVPNAVSSKGRITSMELSRTRELIEAHEGPLLIAAHYPVLNDTYAYHTKGERQLRDADALLDVLRLVRGETLYVSGHVHRFSLVRDEVNQSLTHLTSGAYFRNDPGSNIGGDFTEIDYAADGFTVHRHTYDGEWKRAKEDVRTLSGAAID